MFFNYKGTYSIVLFAMVDADYCFRYIDVGQDDRANDSTVFKNSTLKIALEQNLLNWSKGGLCVGDDAFCLTTYCLKPFSYRGLTVEERVFNYRLLRARRVVENAFGILASRFRIFNTPIPLNVNTVEILGKTACSLYNWQRQNIFSIRICGRRRLKHGGYSTRGVVKHAELNASNRPPVFFKLLWSNWRRGSEIVHASIYDNIISSMANEVNRYRTNTSSRK